VTTSLHSGVVRYLPFQPRLHLAEVAAPQAAPISMASPLVGTNAAASHGVAWAPHPLEQQIQQQKLQHLEQRLEQPFDGFDCFDPLASSSEPGATDAQLMRPGLL